LKLLGLAVLAFLALGCGSEQTGVVKAAPPAGGPPKSDAHPPGFTPPTNQAGSLK